MDSLDELYLVAGIGDAFMGAFGELVTVYLKRDGLLNVNETDPARLMVIARIMAENPADPALLDPLFLDRLVKLIHVRTLGGFLSLSPADLGGLVTEAGVKVNQTLLQPGPGSPFTDRAETFRLRASGRAGDVTKTLDVVMRAEKIQPNVPMPGRIVHWREE
jgi:general secretion pathway protein K